jgi:hypothetical protein
MEKKYRYRKDDNGNKIENEDIADVYNTVLKMAKKRAYIDGILSSTGASDIFTQDFEELPEEIRGDVGEDAPKSTKPEVKPPVSKSSNADMGDPSKAISCECGAAVSEKVADFSKKKYGRVTCFTCQGKA